MLYCKAIITIITIITIIIITTIIAIITSPLVRYAVLLCRFIYLFIYVYKLKRTYSILVPQELTAINDIDVQHTKVTNSIKLHNMKLRVVGHYFC